MAPALAQGTKLHAGKKMGNESTKPSVRSSVENEPSEHKLSRLEIEIHRGGENQITGHTIKHHFPTSYSKSGAFGEYKEPETYVFDGNGQSSSHGHMADHMAEHMPHIFGASKGFTEAENKEGQGDDDQHSTYEA